MKDFLKAAFTGKTAIATWIAIALLIAISVLVFKTRNDPFPEKPAVTK